MSDYIVSWLWDFGDGSTSTDKNPVHTYRMPGIYVAKLTITTSAGNTYESTETIYVYDFDYTFSGLYLSEPDYCFKYAHKLTQGAGISEYGGDHWIRPVAVTGTAKGFDENNEPISLAIDHRTQNIYRLGVPEVWKDAKDSYGGYDIAGRIKLPENTSRAGEFETMRHKETHLGIRPWNEEYKGADGYNSDGFLETQQFSLKGYSDGSLAHEVQLRDLIRKGDYAFTKEFQNNRLQLEFLTSASAWRLATVQTHFQEIDESALPQYNYTVEKQYQAEYSGVDFWLSRNRPAPLRDRATSQLLTGTYDQTMQGPDGRSSSALAFTNTGGVEMTLSYVIANFSLSVWLSQLITLPGTIWQFQVQGGGTLTISVTESGGVYSLRFDDGTDAVSQTLQWDGISWVLLTIERSGSSLLIYENDILRGTVALSAVRAYGGASGFCPNCDIVVFDPRRVKATAISSEALSYYYDDVLNNAGAGGILP